MSFETPLKWSGSPSGRVDDGSEATWRHRQPCGCPGAGKATGVGAPKWGPGLTPAPTHRSITCRCRRCPAPRGGPVRRAGVCRPCRRRRQHTHRDEDTGSGTRAGQSLLPQHRLEGWHEDVTTVRRRSFQKSRCLWTADRVRTRTIPPTSCRHGYGRRLRACRSTDRFWPTPRSSRAGPRHCTSVWEPAPDRRRERSVASAGSDGGPLVLLRMVRRGSEAGDHLPPPPRT